MQIKPKLKLTSRNYFTAKNRYLSNSRISDWLKCKRYFYERHIEYTIDFKPTPAMIIGSGVDAIVTGSQGEFERRFEVKALKKDDPELYKEQQTTTKTLITVETYLKIMSMAAKVMDTKAYKELKGYKRQQILQCDIPLGEHFVGLCNIPDFIKIDHKNKVINIVDLKTTQDATPHKYHYKCLDFGYYRQAAMAVLILMENDERLKDYDINCRHLTVEKDPDNINNVYTFQLNSDKVREELVNLVNIIEDIDLEEDFLPLGADWNDVVLIGVSTTDL